MLNNENLPALIEHHTYNPGRESSVQQLCAGSGQ